MSSKPDDTSIISKKKKEMQVKTMRKHLKKEK